MPNLRSSAAETGGQIFCELNAVVEGATVFARWSCRVFDVGGRSWIRVYRLFSQRSQPAKTRDKDLEQARCGY